jgi:hypothetical protein
MHEPALTVTGMRGCPGSARTTPPPNKELLTGRRNER